jgi:hypothetical protein
LENTIRRGERWFSKVRINKKTRKTRDEAAESGEGIENMEALLAVRSKNLSV